jgi:hypothetical protein
MEEITIINSIFKTEFKQSNNMFGNSANVLDGYMIGYRFYPVVYICKLDDIFFNLTGTTLFQIKDNTILISLEIKSIEDLEEQLRTNSVLRKYYNYLKYPIFA